jgi:sugar lactone lactonase YvrE
MAAGDDGAIYIGTSLRTVGEIESRGQDVLERYDGYPGGHLYRFDPVGNREARVRMQHPQPGEPLTHYEDLGVPIPGEGIVHLLAGEGELYGVTFPGGHFFVTDLETGETEDKGAIVGQPLNEEPFRSIPRAMVIDHDGLVWGAGDYGALFHYDPETGTITHHPELRLPSVLGREFMTILDAMVLAPDGTIYGGTSDGFLFRFDPTAPKIVNLGKPMWQSRIRGLAFSQEGDLYGVGGERGGAARLFVYRTTEGGYENLGLLDVNRSPYYAWLAFETDSMLTGPDGTIFIGESGRISHLYLLYPWR